MKNKLICLAIIILAVIIAATRIAIQGIPDAADKKTSLQEFSSERAMEHLKEIAYEKRHVNSPLHAKTRVYIERYMNKLGYEVVIQDAVSVRSWLPNYHIASSVKNIAARKKGTAAGSKGAVMIMSHYDSVPAGPGAADAGYGVASMLESARALTNAVPMKNDIIFLFTDAEEGGLMGANAFLAEHPWRGDVKAVINLEARGTEGPAVLFETGPDNGRLVKEFIRAAPNPVGNSLSNAVYSHIPNDTDYTLFKDAGIQGFNFANIQRVTAYHTPLDNLKNANPRTIQHLGETSLALAKALGSISLNEIRSSDMTYFNIIGSIMAGYPVIAAFVFAAIALLAFAALTAIAVKKKFIRPLRMIASIGIMATMTAAVTASVYGVWRFVNIIHPDYEGMFMGDTYNAVWYRIAFTALSAFMISGLILALRKKIALTELTASAMTIWSLFFIASLIYLPAGSHVFLWPLIFALVQFAVFIFKPDDRGARWEVAIFFLSIPALFFMADTLMSIYVGLTLRMVFAAALVTALFFILLVPLIDLTIKKGGPLPVIIAGTVFIVSLIGGSATSGFDEENPKPNLATYALDSETGKASWLSCDATVDSWTSQFFNPPVRRTIPEFYPMAERCLLKKYHYLAAPAPELRLVPPKAEIVSDKTAAMREISFRISSPRKARQVVIILKTDQGIKDIAVEGRPLKNIDPRSLKPGHRLITSMIDLENWEIIVCNPVSDAGFTVSLRCKGGAKIEVRLLDISDTLPDITRWGLKPRPKDMMTGPDFLLNEGIIVAKKYFL